MKTLAVIFTTITVIYVSYRIYRYISLDKGLDKVYREGATILDVRTEREYLTGHIAGSVNIALSKLHADTLALDKSATYITVCSHGLRSAKAAKLLREKGYKNVYNGGAWSDLAATLNPGQ